MSYHTKHPEDGQTLRSLEVIHALSSHDDFLSFPKEALDMSESQKSDSYILGISLLFVNIYCTCPFFQLSRIAFVTPKGISQSYVYFKK